MFRPRQQAKLARGTEDEEHPMSEKLYATVAVIGGRRLSGVPKSLGGILAGRVTPEGPRPTQRSDPKNADVRVPSRRGASVPGLDSPIS